MLFVLKAWITARLGVETERGSNLVEYMFLLVLIALVVMLGVMFIGRSTSEKWDQYGQVQYPT
jgi:Flp pilus assembly pilin Flp